MRKVPNIKEFILKDYLVLGPSFTGLIFIGLSVYFYFFENNLFGFYGLGSIGVLLLIFACARLFILRKLFVDGVETTGKITRISFYRQSCRIVFEFDYDSDHLKTVWTTVKNKQSRNMKNSSDIRLLVNPKKPKQAVVLDLFDQ